MSAKIPQLIRVVLLIAGAVVVVVIPPHTRLVCLLNCDALRTRTAAAVWLSTHMPLTDGRISISHITASFVAPRVMAFFLHAGNITPLALREGCDVRLYGTVLGLLRVALCGQSAIFAPDQKWHQTCR